MDVAQALFLVKYVFARRKITGVLNLDYKLKHTCSRKCIFLG